MNTIINSITIFDTQDMLTEFEERLGCVLKAVDRLELFHQLFQILDKHTPPDLTDRKILSYDSLVFANHLKVDAIAVDAIAYHLLVQVWQRLQQQGCYIDDKLMYFPFSMHGKDLCVRRYNS